MDNVGITLPCCISVIVAYVKLNYDVAAQLYVVLSQNYDIFTCNKTI